jgi:hypothetical protein
MPLRRARANPLANNVAPDSLVVVLAALQAMQQELATLRQDILVAPVGSASTVATQGAIPAGAIHAGAIPGGAAKVAPPVSGISLMHWISLKLDSFNGRGSPVEAADWIFSLQIKVFLITDPLFIKARYIECT